MSCRVEKMYYEDKCISLKELYTVEDSLLTEYVCYDDLKRSYKTNSF